MLPPEVLETRRLFLREWLPEDREPFAVMNADPQVTEFLGGVLSRQASDELVDRIVLHFQRCGFGLFAAELKHEQRFVGYVGLACPSFTAHFTPCVEIGWRIDRAYWNQGLATEGARTMLEYAWNALRLEEVVSFTVPANQRSQRVMEKIGLTCDPNDDFDHPGLPEGHPLRRHVLYRIQCPSDKMSPD